MGNSLTVDSEVSRIDDILEVDRNLLQHIRLKKEVPDIVNFHLKVDTAHEMWKLSTIDNEMNFHNFLPISLLDVTAKDLVFGEEDVVISLLVYRGTNPGQMALTQRETWLTTCPSTSLKLLPS